MNSAAWASFMSAAELPDRDVDEEDLCADCNNCPDCCHCALLCGEPEGLD